MRLLDARRFVKFAGDRGVRPGGGPRGGIERLWQVGWLPTSWSTEIHSTTWGRYAMCARSTWEDAS